MKSLAAILIFVTPLRALDLQPVAFARAVGLRPSFLIRPLAGLVQPHAIAIELDLVQPAIAFGRERN